MVMVLVRICMCLCMRFEVRGGFEVAIYDLYPSELHEDENHYRKTMHITTHLPTGVGGGFPNSSPTPNCFLT